MSHVSSSGPSSGQCVPSVACRSAFGLCALHLDCPPRSLAQIILMLHPWPVYLSPTQLSLRRRTVSILTAMQCGPVSDHSFCSMSNCFHSRWGPGTACVAGSWAILLITPAKLCAREESRALVCV